MKLSSLLVLILVAGSAAAEPGPSSPLLILDPVDTLHFDGGPDRGVLINGTYSYGAGEHIHRLFCVCVSYHMVGGNEFRNPFSIVEIIGQRSMIS